MARERGVLGLTHHSGSMTYVRPPKPSSVAASARMKANRGRDTSPELRLRQELHNRDMRYRTHMTVLPGSRRNVDIVFSRVRLAVFVDGCFWHGCPVHGSMAKANREYWETKIAENQQRDRDTDVRLRSQGWTPLHIWEHQPVKDAADLVQETYSRLLGSISSESEVNAESRSLAEAEGAEQTGWKHRLT